MGIGFLRAGVGDKHVYRLMKKSGAILGGEPSGHVILRHRQTSGDGMLTALLLYEGPAPFRLRRRRPASTSCSSSRSGRSTSASAASKDLKRWPAFRQAAGRFAGRYGRRARLLVRYSGTEPKIRIMIEARDLEIIEQNMPIFQSLVENEIGE